MITEGGKIWMTTEVDLDVEVDIFCKGDDVHIDINDGEQGNVYPLKEFLELVGAQREHLEKILESEYQGGIQGQRTPESLLKGKRWKPAEAST